MLEIKWNIEYFIFKYKKIFQLLIVKSFLLLLLVFIAPFLFRVIRHGVDTPNTTIILSRPILHGVIFECTNSFAYNRGYTSLAQNVNGIMNLSIYFHNNVDLNNSEMKSAIGHFFINFPIIHNHFRRQRNFTIYISENNPAYNRIRNNMPMLLVGDFMLNERFFVNSLNITPPTKQ